LVPSSGTPHHLISIMKQWFILALDLFVSLHMGVNTLKGATKYKVKVLSKDYIWHIAFMCWSIFLISTFFIPSLQLCFEYNYFNTYLINSWLWKSLKIETMNFESLKINKITSSTWCALNKMLKQQICIKNVFHHENN
jgi:hypothetical protein